jgi:aerobic C4-dicarboxylate transport protein
VLLFSVLFGFALLRSAAAARRWSTLIDQARTRCSRSSASSCGWRRSARSARWRSRRPYGIGSLLSLGKLMAGVYLTCLLFIFVVLGRSRGFARLQLWKFLRYIKRGDPDRARHVVVGVGAAADDGEAGEPRLREAGRRPRRPDRLLVQPRRHLDLHDDGGGVRGAGERRAAVARAAAVDAGVLLLTSKGAAAVTGSGFITLAATLSAIPTIPVAGWRCSSASIASCRRRARSPT